METRAAKRKRLLNPPTTIHTNHNDDRISNLPDDVLHHVLFLLPIKSIAKTSVLSKRWRNLWYSFPDHDFTTVNSPSNAKNSNAHKRTHRYMDQILGLIKKRSDIRVLRFKAFLSFTRLNGLIRDAVRHNIQELDIEVSTSDYFNFPRMVLKSGSLRVLRLKSRKPGFRLPPLEIMKDGFRNLSSLSLSRAILHDGPSLDNLFSCSSFPLLKKLHLEACFELEHLRIECSALEDICLECCIQLEGLEICVPKLRRLKVHCCFDVYSTTSWVKIDAPTLENIHWSHNAVTGETVFCNLVLLNEAFVGYSLNKDLSAAKNKSLSNFLLGISHCRSLIIESYSSYIHYASVLLKNHLSAGASLCLFDNLKSLELSTGLNKNTNPCISRLLRSTPMVHTITININSDHNAESIQSKSKDLWESSNSGEEIYWESQVHSLKSCLDHLKVVRINGIPQCSNDVSLLKFLLKHGKALQKVNIICSSPCKPKDYLLRQRIKSQMMGFSRASTEANIVFQEVR